MHICHFLIDYNIPKMASLRSKTPTQPAPLLSPQSRELSQHLRQHREGLGRKLEAHTFRKNKDSVPACEAHKTIISFYDNCSHSLLCSVCLSKQAKGGKLQMSQMSPAEEARTPMERDIKLMSSRIEKELSALSEIEDILYNGFEREKQEFESKAKELEAIYQDIITQIMKKAARSREILFQKYVEERTKHEIVIKELALLKSMASDYFTLSKQNSQQRDIGSLMQAHLLQNDICGHLKFTGKGFKWEEGLHHNNVKVLGEMEVKKAALLRQGLAEKVDPKVKSLVMSDYKVFSSIRRA